MTDARTDFEGLMQRIRAGCPDAMRDMCLRYGKHILNAVRRKMHQRLRKRCGSEDIVQDVWTSFVAFPPEEITFATPRELVYFLCRMAHNKVADVYRDQLNSKRDINRELPLQALHRTVADVRQTTPSQVAIADERWQRLLEGAPPGHRPLVEMLRLGHTYDEIAQRYGLHPKTVQRLLQKLAERLES